MRVFFIGCLHLGHKNMAIHRGFQNECEHDEYLIKQWNSIVTKKKDIVYILGDITMEKACYYPYLNKLNGVKHVVLGNHDRRQDVPELLKYVNTIAGAINYKGYILTHIPIHPNEIGRFKGNIHAHIHHINTLDSFVVNKSYNDEDEDNHFISTFNRYYNVDAKLIDFKPKTIEELLKINKI